MYEKTSIGISVKPVRRVRYAKPNGSYGFRWESCVPCQTFQGKRAYEWQWGIITSEGTVLNKCENRHDAEQLLKTY